MTWCATTIIVATPADWKRGDQCVILPSVSNDDATKLFPAGFTTVRTAAFPYLSSLSRVKPIHWLTID
jgi:hypothetical protein